VTERSATRVGRGRQPAKMVRKRKGALSSALFRRVKVPLALK
jgi:hypothetical protein